MAPEGEDAEPRHRAEGGQSLVGDPPFDAVPFEDLQLFQMRGTVEMPEHGASQLHVVELHEAQTRQPLKSREARLGQSFKPWRRIDAGLRVVQPRQETKLLD